MERLLWAGLAMFVAIFVINMIRGVYLGRQFHLYLEQNHPDHWKRIYLDQWLRKAFLWPFMTGTPVDCERSEENFGDPQITVYKMKGRQVTLVAFATMIAIAVWGLLLGIVLPMWLDR
jgi:hypothetical protein